MIRPQLLMTAQQAVAKAFAGEGITVLFDAVTPRADLKNRVMHLRPMPEEVAEAELVDIRADCDHELAHFLYTDPAALAAIDRQLVRLIVNAIEDGFVERVHGGKFLGVAENLAISNARQFDQIKARATDTVVSRRSRALTGLMMLAGGATEDEVYDALLDDIQVYMAPIRDLIPSLAAIESTWDSKHLGEEITARWRWDLPEDERADESASTSPDGGVPEAQDETSSSAVAPLEPIDFDVEDQVAERLESELPPTRRKRRIAKLDFRRAKVYRARTVKDTVGPVPEPRGTAPAYTAPVFMQSVRQIAGPLRRRLLMEFRGPGLVVSRNQRRGHVDQRALHKIPVGDFNVFQSKIVDLVIDRDVTLMVDCSGSMLFSGDCVTPYGSDRSETRLWVAAQAACACSLVLDLLGITHEVLGWTTRGRSRPNKHYERVTPLHHMVVKPATASFHRCHTNFVKLAHLEEPAENIDGEALLWGALRLATRVKRSGKRPLLIVFSDGEPLSSPEDPAVLAWHLREAVRRIEAAGIPTLGVGIQTRSVEKFYPRWAVVNDLSDLVGRFYELLREQLRESRRTAG